MVDVAIQALAVGGEGVGPDPSGRITFVPYVAPGETVRALVVEDKKRHARAELVEVLERAPERVEPPCSLFASRECGGCQWLHLDLAVQHQAKSEFVRRELRKAVAAGMEVLPLIADVPPLGWRRRARLHWFRARGTERAVIGFCAPRSRRVNDVETCPQLARPVADAMAIIREELGPHLTGRGEIEILAGYNGHIHVSIGGWCSPKYASRLLGKGGLLGSIVGVVLHPPPEMRGDAASRGFPRGRSQENSRRAGWHTDAHRAGARKDGDPGTRVGGARDGDALRPLRWGKREITVEPGLRGRADYFAQASEAGNQALLRAVESACGDLTGKHIVEFYAGAGNLSRMLKRGRPAELVTTDSRMVPWYKLERVGAAGDVASDLVDDGYYFDLAVLDPPRTGAAELIAPLVELHPARIVYVSCDPATLARDVARLMDHGYHPLSAQPLDLMPQTAHVEIVVSLIADAPAAGYGQADVDEPPVVVADTRTAGDPGPSPDETGAPGDD